LFLLNSGCYIPTGTGRRLTPFQAFPRSRTFYTYPENYRQGEEVGENGSEEAIWGPSSTMEEEILKSQFSLNAQKLIFIRYK
jgi:hypothetical protein